jgi:hypothetical protein
VTIEHRVFFHTEGEDIERYYCYQLVEGFSDCWHSKMEHESGQYNAIVAHHRKSRQQLVKGPDSCRVKDVYDGGILFVNSGEDTALLTAFLDVVDNTKDQWEEVMQAVQDKVMPVVDDAEGSPDADMRVHEAASQLPKWLMQAIVYSPLHARRLPCAVQPSAEMFGMCEHLAFTPASTPVVSLPCDTLGEVDVTEYWLDAHESVSDWQGELN